MGRHNIWLNIPISTQHKMTRQKILLLTVTALVLTKPTMRKSVQNK